MQRVDKKEKREEEEEAAFTSPDSSVTRTPRRALRGRGETRAKSAAPPASSADTNGTPSAAGSGRVLRDRSTRSVPVWRRRDLGVEQDDDDDDDDGEEEEEEEEAEARRRRKTAYPRRRRNTEAARDNKTQYGNTNYTNSVKCMHTPAIRRELPVSPTRGSAEGCCEEQREERVLLQVLFKGSGLGSMNLPLIQIIPSLPLPSPSTSV